MLGTHRTVAEITSRSELFLFPKKGHSLFLSSICVLASFQTSNNLPDSANAMSKSSAPTKDYVLGQSDSEQDRLAAQHELIWRETGSSSAFMAPVKNPKKLTAICDLGCGTGAWLNRAAGEAENAVLFGFDLSAAKFAPAWADPSVNGGRIVLGTKDALQPWPPALQGRFDVINCLFFALWVGSKGRASESWA